MAINVFPASLGAGVEKFSNMIGPSQNVDFPVSDFPTGTYRFRAFSAAGNSTPIVTLNFIKNSVIIATVSTVDWDTGSTANFSEIITPVTGDYDTVRMLANTNCFVSILKLATFEASINVITRYTASQGIVLAKPSTFVAFGGGGGGGAAFYYGAGGAGSGRFVRGNLAAGPGNIIIGAGGAGSNDGSVGGTGGFTRVVVGGVTHTANGGAGGASADSGGGGAGGSGGGSGAQGATGRGGGGGGTQGNNGGVGLGGPAGGTGSGMAVSSLDQQEMQFTIGSGGGGGQGGGFYGGGGGGNSTTRAAGNAANGYAGGGGGASQQVSSNSYFQGGAGGAGVVYMIDKVY
jgi:hypothetical protein